MFYLVPACLLLVKQTYCNFGYQDLNFSISLLVVFLHLFVKIFAYLFQYCLPFNLEYI